MRPVSQRFLSTLTGSHRQYTKVTVSDTFQTGVSPTGTELLVADGACTFDSTADVRGRLDLTVDGRTDWPSDPSKLLSPYGNELFVQRGIVFGPGDIETVSQGYFRIHTVRQSGDPKNPLVIEAYDRMKTIEESQLEQPRQFNRGATIESIYQNLIGEVFPTFQLECDEPAMLAHQLLRGHICEQDRRKFIEDLGKSWGKITYWDYRGVLVVKDPPNPRVPLLKVRGGPGGVLVEASRTLTREGAYNAAVVTGEGTDEKDPARGVVRDMNPKSPTYWLGNFGKKPRFFSHPMILTDEQAVKAARTMLTRLLGVPYTANFSIVPNSALEPYDPILLRFDDSDEMHVLDQVVVPLTVDAPVTATTRLQVDIEELTL